MAAGVTNATATTLALLRGVLGLVVLRGPLSRPSASSRFAAEARRAGVFRSGRDGVSACRSEPVMARVSYACLYAICIYVCMYAWVSPDACIHTHIHTYEEG